MADRDWRQFFGDDEQKFEDWFQQWRTKLITRVRFKFGLPLETAGEVVSEALKRCLERPQPENLRHLQGALVLATDYVALEFIRAGKQPVDENNEVTACSTTSHHISEVEELPDGGAAPEESVEKYAARQFLNAEVTALNEHFLNRATEDPASGDALRVLETILCEGYDLKRAEMINQSGLSDAAYDQARKRLTRAAVHKQVRLRAAQLIMARLFERDEIASYVLNGGVPVNGVPTESEYAKAKERIRRARAALDRDFAAFAGQMASSK